MNSISIVEYFGERHNYPCGYCKGNNCASHGLWAHQLTVQDYQDLIDRGWRRSGQYCYKPLMSETCCPSYTIKCDALKFKLSKSHKKILKRLNKFLKDGLKEKPSSANVDFDKFDDKTEEKFCNNENFVLPKQNDLNNLENIKLDKINEKTTSDLMKAVKHQNQNTTTSEIGINSKKSDLMCGSSCDSEGTMNRPPKKKAKILRLERKLKKLSSQGITNLPEKSIKNIEKSLKDYFDEEPKDGVHKLQIKSVMVDSSEFDITLPVTYDLYKKYQTIIHNDPPETVQEFLDFLKESPLKHEKSESTPSMGYGSFHQQYWLDDKLIAVAVIDILPYCVSSVYFFYDPDYSFLSLGTYGSLRELQFTQELSKNFPELSNYYMGYYIHSCPKMRYKGKLHASYLLCPETYKWRELNDDVINLLNNTKYARLNLDIDAIDENDITEADLPNVFIYNHGGIYPYKEFLKMYKRSHNEKLLEYGHLIGRKCLSRMVIVLK